MTDTFTIAQLSDPHLSSLEGVGLCDLLDKRLIGYLWWRLSRRAKYRPKILAALVEDLKAQQPDHTVVTGDLTHVGLPHECSEVATWLGVLGTPEEVTVVPGNHDAYVTADWEETLGKWTPYMASDVAGNANGLGHDACFPSLRVRGSVAFIGLSTARPSAPFFAVGSLGKSQLEKFQQILVDTHERDLFRVVLLHHPPVAGTVPWQKRLTDSREFASVIRQHGADLILHGHAHRACVETMPAKNSRVSVFGVPAASVSTRASDRVAQYHLYRLNRNASRWDVAVSVRGYSVEEERVVSFGPASMLT